jgi:hypothetical protein
MSNYARPGVLRWFWYAFGGGLPARHSTWVLHDMTCRTWVVRHIVRSLVQLTIPIVLALVFIPVSLPIRVLTVITAGGPSVLLMVLNINGMCEHRLIKAGYPPEIGEGIRQKRAVTAQATSNYARQAARAARR